MRLIAVVIAAALLCAPAFAQKLRGDDARQARDHLRNVRRDWSTAPKSEKYRLILSLQRWPESSVTRFLLELIEKETDDDVASWAARCIARHNDTDDQRALLRAFSRAGTPERRAACVRWLGLYGKDAPLAELEKAAMSDDGSAEAAVRAAADVGSDGALVLLENAARQSKLPEARVAACALLLGVGDERGVDALSAMPTLEHAARAAHAAVGSGLETDALLVVLERAKGAKRGSEPPHMTASLLARLTRVESHKAVLAARGALRGVLGSEIDWWVISVNRAQVPLMVAAGLEGDDVLNTLRALQRLPEHYRGEELENATAKLGPLLESADVNVSANALLACAATGAAAKAASEKVAEWLKSEDSLPRAAALLAAGPMKLDHAERAIELLEDETWWVVSAALDCLLHLRPAHCLKPVFALAEREQEGRVFGEAIALLCDLTGQDHGDLLPRWTEALSKEIEIQPRKLASLRGVPYQRLRQKTGVTFFGMELNSTNIQFAVDRSVSMALPVAREPERPDFANRKSDILRRRPESGRMSRDGYLPRFYVAAAELHAALDAMSQRARFGITLFNQDLLHSERAVNGIAERRKAVNWMLSTDPQGGTNIKAALLSIIEGAEADTIVLLSDGDPTSIQINEEIHRANAIKRLDISVVSVHEHEHFRHYPHAMAAREAGNIIDAEPED